MKKNVLSALFAIVSLCCNAQFVLTPSAGLMTEDGPYTILRNGSESENYDAAKKLSRKPSPEWKLETLNMKSLLKQVLNTKLTESCLVLSLRQTGI